MRDLSEYVVSIDLTLLTTTDNTGWTGDARIEWAKRGEESFCIVSRDADPERLAQRLIHDALNEALKVAGEPVRECFQCAKKIMPLDRCESVLSDNDNFEEWCLECAEAQEERERVRDCKRQQAEYARRKEEDERKDRLNRDRIRELECDLMDVEDALKKERRRNQW